MTKAPLAHPTTMSPDRPRTPSQSQRVADGVRGRIQSGELGPGARVPPEPELMRAYGVSRSVVREAVSQLQAQGLVDTRHGIGSFVRAPAAPMHALMGQAPQAVHLRQKLAMLELRLSLEADAAALAAQRRSPEQLQAMQQALDEFARRAAAGEDTAESDFRFHELVAQATGNEYFVHVLRSLSSATIPRDQAPPPPDSAPRFGEPTPALRPGKERSVQEHHAVLDAIGRGDPALARAAMFMHLNNSRDRMKHTLD